VFAVACGGGNNAGPDAGDDPTTDAGADARADAPRTDAGTDAPPPDASPCGNGMHDGNEACDDGNTNSNDGCSATCAVEQDCTCSGTPSTCSCATVQLITATTQTVDTASLALDGTGQPHVIYYYAIDYTDPVTNYLREHGHAMYAQRPTTSWTNYEIQAWDQTRTSMGPEEFSLAYDGGMLRTFMHRIYNTAGTFAQGTRTGTSWTFAYDSPYYIYDVARGAADWHALVAGSGIGDYRYYMGAPGNWVRNEPLTGFGTGYPMRIASASNGDVYITQITPASGHASYNLKLSKRLNATTWATIYDVPTTGTCVYPISHDPLALTNGAVMTFEDGFNGSGQRWLKAHRLVGTSWVVEDVADWSWLNATCAAFSASYSLLRTVSAVDPLGQPHILYASAPQNNSLTLEDHYRDATGWHVRTFPFTKGTPLDMVIDAAGTTHIIAMQPSSTVGTTRLVYIRISASAW
jgi:cysteine-rich repeat protein